MKCWVLVDIATWESDDLVKVWVTNDATGSEIVLLHGSDLNTADSVFVGRDPNGCGGLGSYCCGSNGRCNCNGAAMCVRRGWVQYTAALHGFASSATMAFGLQSNSRDEEAFFDHFSIEGTGKHYTELFCGASTCTNYTSGSAYVTGAACCDMYTLQLSNMSNLVDANGNFRTLSIFDCDGTRLEGSLGMQHAGYVATSDDVGQINICLAESVGYAIEMDTAPAPSNIGWLLINASGSTIMFGGAAGASTCLCSAGTYEHDNDRSTPCQPCPAGRYSESTGATSCNVSCLPGSYSAVAGAQTAAATACVDCTAGQFDGDANPSTPCERCPAGQYSDVVGAVSWPCIVSCLPGSYSAVTGAQSSAATACVDCAAGRFDHDGDPSTPCEMCIQGQYSDSAGATSCSSCSPGRFASIAGDRTSMPSACVPCVAGKFDNDTDALTPCQRCPSGQYSESAGAISCDTCPSNASMTDPRWGATSLDDCGFCPVGVVSTCAVGQFCAFSSGRKWTGKCTACGNACGCMDSRAANYDANATLSDGSCTYIIPTTCIDDANGALAAERRWQVPGQDSRNALSCPLLLRGAGGDCDFNVGRVGLQAGTLRHQCPRSCRDCVPDPFSRTVSAPPEWLSYAWRTTFEANATYKIQTVQMVWCAATDLDSIRGSFGNPCGQTLRPVDDVAVRRTLFRELYGERRNGAAMYVRAGYALSDGDANNRASSHYGVTMRASVAYCSFINNYAGKRYHHDGAAASKGGAIYVTGAVSMTIAFTLFERNKAESGGALYALTVPTGISISYSNFTGNLIWPKWDGSASPFSAKLLTSEGGAICAYGTVMNITHTIFDSNYGYPSGGAIAVRGGFYLEVTADLIERCVSGYSQCGRRYPTSQRGFVAISNSWFYNNSAQVWPGSQQRASGGAVDVLGASVTIAESTFVDNYVGCMDLASYLRYCANTWCQPWTFYSDPAMYDLRPIRSTKLSTFQCAARTDYFGGAVYARGGQVGAALSIANTFFTENRAHYGGAVYTQIVTKEAGINISIAGTTFDSNVASAKNDHVSIFTSDSYKVYNTTFTPYAPEFSRSVSFGGPAATCDEYPCAVGEKCSYINSSLWCGTCSVHTVSLTGNRCSSCPPGTGPNGDQTGCISCLGGYYSPYGICQDCAAPRVINALRTSCTACAAGQGPSSNRSACEPCPGNSFSTDGVCSPCFPGLVANAGKTGCTDIAQAGVTIQADDVSLVESIVSSSATILPKVAVQIHVTDSAMVAGSTEQANLIDALTRDMSAALGVDEHVLRISNLRSVGSVGDGRRRRVQATQAAKFDLVILSNASSVLDELTKQMADPTSALSTGSATGAINRAVSPTVDFVCPVGMIRPIGAANWDCLRCADPSTIPNYPEQTLCLPCPFNQMSNIAGDACICMDGTYNASSGIIACYMQGDSYSETDFASSVGSLDSHCRSCAAGLSQCVECENGVVTVSAGFSTGPAQGISLNFQNGPRPVFECALSDQCPGEVESVMAIKCGPQYDGPLCAVCAPDHSRRGLDHRRPCELCENASTTVWTVVFMLAILGACAAVFVLIRVKASESSQHNQELQEGQDDGNDDGHVGRLAAEQATISELAICRMASSANAVSSARTYIGLSQILNGMQFAFDIQFPSAFKSILNLLKLLALDIFATIQLGCLGSWTFYHKFIVTTLSPLLLGGMLVGFYRFHARSLPAGSAIAQTQRDRALKVGFNFIFLIYPLVSQTVFQSFKCQALGTQHEYLQVDFQSDCGTGSYILLVVVAVLMVFLYPIGVPAALFALMWKNREDLAKQDSQARSDFAPLVELYKLESWYWCASGI
jgi:predicted outer membrane repeat protein